MLINSPNISGSLTVTGNSVISGSLNVLGSITGAITGSATTASYVEYTNVANKPALVSGSSQVTYSGLTGIPSGIVSGSSQVSFNGIVDKPTLVSGSSQITYSGLTGIPSGIISGSAQITGYGIFATTGSNQFNGNQAITGSLTTTGQIIAQTLNVQQVTSSIVYSSGSNIFGNSVSNTQQFTGSVGVTGSLTVTTNGVELQVTNTGVNLGNALTDSHIISGSLRVNPNGLFVSGSGNVGIGTTTPQSDVRLHIQSSASGGQNLRIQTSIAAGRNYVQWANGSGDMGFLGYGGPDSKFYIVNQLNDDMIISTNNTERMRIASGGLVTVTGTGAGANSEGIFFKRTNNLAQGGYINGNGGVLQIVATNEQSSLNGNIYFQRYNGTSTTTSMVIDSDGAVLIGHTGNDYGRLDVTVPPSTYSAALGLGVRTNSAEGNSTGISFKTKISLSGAIWENARIAAITELVTASAYGTLAFYTMNATTLSERMRITSNGNVGIGTTSPSDRLEVIGDIKQATITSVGGKYARKVIHTGSAFDNPTVNLYTAGTDNNSVNLIKVTVFQTLFGSEAGNIHVGYARIMGQNASGQVTAMTVEHNGGTANVGTLSWSGHTLRYTCNRASNYDGYEIIVEISGQLALSSW